jgi:hypothetical protein
MNDKIVAAKNFVARHKVAIAVTATAAVCYKVHSAAISQHNEFLKEHGLFEQFYTPEG